MRIPLIVSMAGIIALAACEQTTTTAPSAGAADPAAATGAAPQADSQLINGAQTTLNRYGFADVDANTLTRDQVIRINRVSTITKRRSSADIRLEINAILARSQ